MERSPHRAFNQLAGRGKPKITQVTKPAEDLGRFKSTPELFKAAEFGKSVAKACGVTKALAGVITEEGPRIRQEPVVVPIPVDKIDITFSTVSDLAKQCMPLEQNGVKGKPTYARKTEMPPISPKRVNQATILSSPPRYDHQSGQLLHSLQLHR